MGGYDVQCPLPATDKYSNIFDKTIKQNALFGEVTYKLTDRWSVTGGLRWFEYDRRELDIYQVPLGLPAVGGLSSGGRNLRSGKSSDMVYKFGTEFHFDDKRMAYFLYSEGFRLGGNNGARAAATGRVPITYDPDTLKNYELGLKSQWLDNSLQLNVSLFLMKWDNIQLNEASGSPYPFWLRGTFNGGTAEQKGVEVNGSWNLTKNLSVEGSVFLADPEFTDETVFPDGDILQKGAPMPASPKRKYWVSTEYTVPQFMGLNGDSWVRWSYTWQSKTWTDTDAIIDNNRDFYIGPWSTSARSSGGPLAKRRNVGNV